MLTITNPKEFENQVENILIKRFKKVMDKARDVGYVATKEKSPQAKGHNRGILRSRLEKTTRASRRDTMYVNGIRFGHLDAGRKDALGKMQKGYRGVVSTNTKPMRDWLESIGKSWMTNLGQIEVGRSPSSRFHGGNKNPIQFGMKEMKTSLERDLGIKFNK